MTCNKLFIPSIIFLLIIIGTLPAISKKKFELTFLNFTCSIHKDNDTLIAAYQCGLSKNSKRRTLYFELTFKREIRSFYINLSVTLKRRMSEFVLFNLTKLNGCHMLSNQNQIPLLQFSRKVLHQYSNLPKQCPLRANFSYYIRGFHFNIDQFPGFNFESDLTSKFEYIIQKKVALAGFIKSHIVYKESSHA